MTEIEEGPGRFLTPEEMKEREVIENGEVIGYGMDGGDEMTTVYAADGTILEQKIKIPATEWDIAGDGNTSTFTV